MKKKKILFILHLPPPAHGAAKVGEFISQSKNLKNEYSCLFIPINSSRTIDDIGRFSFRKLALAIDLFIRIYLISHPLLPIYHLTLTTLKNVN